MKLNHAQYVGGAFWGHALGQMLLALIVLVAAGCQSDPELLERHFVDLDLQKMSRLSFRYVEDGAGDGSIAELREECVGALMGPDRILVLIDHLDDIRPSLSTYESNGSGLVPIGYLCLDLLLVVLDGDSYPHLAFNDDGWGAEVADEFYFRPDVLDHGKGQAEMQAVKRKWEILYAGGRFRYSPFQPGEVLDDF